MLISMRVLRGAYSRGLSTVASVLGLVCLSSGVWAGEFYSWIDTSGTMVFTDDASRIPPENVRSPVAVHRVPDRPPALFQTPESGPGFIPAAAAGPTPSPA